MTLTPEQTALVVRTLAERVMRLKWRTTAAGNIYAISKRGESEMVYWFGCGGKGDHSATWNPTTSRDDMAEVEARLTDAQWRAHVNAMCDFWHRDDFGTYSFERWLLTVPPLVRAVCLCRALGVQIG